MSFIEINVGEDGYFEETVEATPSRIERLMKLEFKNVHSQDALTHCKVQIANIEPWIGLNGPWVLRDEFTLAAGDHEFIPLAGYGETRSPDDSYWGDRSIVVTTHQGTLALSRDAENILTIRGTAVGSAPYETNVVVWVSAGTRLRVRKQAPLPAQNEEIVSLETATSEAYGAARSTEVGRTAESMNTSGVLTWFVYYFIENGISIYGNVRNSTRREPILFRYLDFEMEGDKIIGKERYGKVIWENMYVTKADQGLLLQKLAVHAKGLKDASSH